MKKFFKIFILLIILYFLLNKETIEYPTTYFKIDGSNTYEFTYTIILINNDTENANIDLWVPVIESVFPYQTVKPIYSNSNYKKNMVDMWGNTLNNYDISLSSKKSAKLIFKYMIKSNHVIFDLSKANKTDLFKNNI